MADGKGIFLGEASVTVNKGADAITCENWETVKKAVCRIRNSKVGIGTGFLAEFKVPFLSTKCIVLATNNHVLPDANLALQSEIVFDTGQQGHTFSGKELFNTEIWRSSDARELDYTLVGINTEVLKVMPCGVPTPISLQQHQQCHTNLQPKDNVYIVHYGSEKGEHVKSLNGYIVHKVIGPLLTHLATTFGGSSGAPIFKAINGQLVAVAIHRGCVPTDPSKAKVNGGTLLEDVLYHVINNTYKQGLPSLSEILQECSEEVDGSPGPMNNSPSEEDEKAPTMEELGEYILQLSPNLLQLASAMNLYDFAMSIKFEAGKATDKCSQLLHKWLTSTASPTWETFYHILRKRGLDMNNMAMEVARKHCPHVLN